MMSGIRTSTHNKQIQLYSFLCNHIYVCTLLSFCVLSFPHQVGQVSHLSLKRRGLREMGVSLENGNVGQRSYDYQSERPWSSLDSEGQYAMSHLNTPEPTGT